MIFAEAMTSLDEYRRFTEQVKAPVLANLTAKIDAGEHLHEAELNYVLALTRLEEMTGVPLPAEGGSK